jgi:hypothetical protein
MLRRLAGLLALAACAILTSPVGADVSYQYVTDQSTYSPQPGMTFTVSVFLLETVTGLDHSVINPPAGHGLLSAGVAVQQTGTPPPATIISSISTNNNAIGAGGGFGNSGSYQTEVATDHSSAALLATAGVAQGPTTDLSGANGGGKILLGTLTLTAGAAYSTTTFSVTSFKNSTGTLALEQQPLNAATTFTTNLGGQTQDLDKNNNNPAYTGANATINTFTVSVVPEPGSMMLCGLAVCGGIFGAYRRRTGLAAKAGLA